MFLDLSILDWGMFLCTIIFTIAAVAYGLCKRKKTASPQIYEYLLMGRQLTLPLFIATLTSTWYGNIFGVTQIAFNHGIYNLITQGIFWYIPYLIFAFFLVDKIRSYNVVSLPELIQRVFGEKIAQFSSVLIFIKTLPIVHAIGCGILLQYIFHVSLSQGIVIAVLFVTLYSAFGSFRAIVFSDFAQCLFMLIGVISVVVFSIKIFGGPIVLLEKLPSSYFIPYGKHSFLITIAWMFIAFTTTLINPTFYQRCFAAKDHKTAKYGILLSIVLWIIIDVCTTLGGMYAKAILPDANPTNAYLVYSLQILPVGYKGLFLGGMMAMILSTLDSFLFLAANTIFYDLSFFRKYPIHIRHLLSLVLTSSCTIVIAICFNDNIEGVWLIIKGSFAVCLFMLLLHSLYLGYRFNSPQSTKYFC